MTKVILFMIAVSGTPPHASLDKVANFYTQETCKTAGETLMKSRGEWVGYACVEKGIYDE